MVFQEAHDGNDTRGCGIDGELILPHSELLDIFRETGHDVLSIGVEVIGHGLVFVGRVDNRGTQGSLG